MFIPGASSTSLPRSLISSPTPAYTSETSASSKVQASSVPMGMSELARFKRMPEGPSVVMTGGTPFLLREGSTPPNAPALPSGPKGLFIL